MRKKVVVIKKTKRIKLPSLRFIFITVLLIGLFFGVYYGIFILKISEIKEVIVKVPENLSDVADKLRLSYIQSINNNIFLAWILKDKKDIFLQNVEFYDGDIEIDFFKKIVILKPKIRNERTIWCNKERNLCFAIDDNDFVSRKVAFLEGAPFLIIESENQLLPNEGKSLKDLAVYFCLKKFNDLLLKKKFFPQYSEVISQSDANIFLNEGFYLKISSDEDCENSFNYFLKVYNNLSENERKKLEYIDLRIGNKIFYKLK